MRLKDKVAIITGGSRGIGFSTADKFLKEGASVVLTASSQESADVAVDKLKEKYPNAIVAGISPNLASMESVRKAFKEATEKYGCVDILVNNAGISENTSFMDYTEETFDKVMDLNVKGVFNTTRVAAECMVARGKGVILSTSSMVSISGQPSGFAYPASKFAVNGLTVSLARELGPKGIRVNAVAPGITETDLFQHYIMGIQNLQEHPPTLFLVQYHLQDNLPLHHIPIRKRHIHISLVCSSFTFSLHFGQMPLNEIS